jgi:excisionase family DNA binding protein
MVKLNKNGYLDNAELFENLIGGQIGRLWTVTDVAGYLHVSQSTIRDWVYKKSISHLKIGRLMGAVKNDVFCKLTDERSC